MTKPGLTVVERFWMKVDKSGDCWVWTASRAPNGYGQFTDAAGKKLLVHRMSYEMAYGPIPVGLLVMHSCDNPPCIRPSHLSLGTVRDNSLDMVAKGRCNPPRLVGEQSGKAKLTALQVQQIRRRHATGETYVSLGRAFGVSNVNIRHIVNRRTWRHVPDLPNHQQQLGATT